MDEFTGKVGTTTKSKIAQGSTFSSAPFQLAQFELLKFGVPDGVRDAAVQWVDQGKKNFDSLLATAEEIYGACDKTLSTATKCMTDCTASVAEAMHKNADAAFDVVHDLVAAKSLPEMFEISTSGARKQFQTLAAQNQELWSRAQEAAIETMKPVTGAMPKIFQAPASS
jgi:phasin